MIITTGEMAVGQIITIYSTNPLKQIVMTMEGEREISVPADYHMLTGIPIEIVSIDLPFIMCKFLVHIPRLPQQQCIIDTRNFVFKEVKADFAKIYRKLYTPKKQIKRDPHGMDLPPGGSMLDLLGLRDESIKIVPPASGQGDLFD